MAIMWSAARNVLLMLTVKQTFSKKNKHTRKKIFFPLQEH